MEKIKETLDYINLKTNNLKIYVAIIVGSGLGCFCDGLDGIRIKYSDIPHFGSSGVKGHKGELLFCEINGKSCVVMQGRFQRDFVDFADQHYRDLVDSKTLEMRIDFGHTSPNWHDVISLGFVGLKKRVEKYAPLIERSYAVDKVDFPEPKRNAPVVAGPPYGSRLGAYLGTTVGGKGYKSVIKKKD